jgi:hypothetical protein
MASLQVKTVNFKLFHLGTKQNATFGDFYRAKTQLSDKTFIPVRHQKTKWRQFIHKRLKQRETIEEFSNLFKPKGELNIELSCPAVSAPSAITKQNGGKHKNRSETRTASKMNRFDRNFHSPSYI